MLFKYFCHAHGCKIHQGRNFQFLEFKSFGEITSLSFIIIKLQIEETILDKVKRERSNWFAKVCSLDESNVAKKVLNLDIPPAKKKGKPKNSWIRQMRLQQQRYGLTQEEVHEKLNTRPTHAP